MKTVSWKRDMSWHYSDMCRKNRNIYALIFAVLLGSVAIFYTIFISWALPHGTQHALVGILAYIVMPAIIYFKMSDLAASVLEKILKVELATNLFSIPTYFFCIFIQCGMYLIWNQISQHALLCIFSTCLMFFIGQINAEDVYYYK